MNISLPPLERARAVEGLYATGHWLLQQERFKDAADVFRAMISVAQEDERGWVALGMCHEGIEQYEIAREIYGAGCTLAKPAVRCALALTRVLRKLGRDEDVQEALDMAEGMLESTDDELAAQLVAEERSFR